MNRHLRIKKRTPIKQDSVNFGSNQVRNKTLAQAIALALLAGSALPATGLAATIQGQSVLDPNDNGVVDTCEQPRANTTIFLRDNNAANAGQGGFFTTTTDANGRYSFVSLNPGPFTIWSDIPWGQRQTAPVRGEGFAMHDFTIANASDTVTINFGIFDPNPNTPPTVTVPNAAMTVNMDSRVNFTATVNHPDNDTTCAVSWDFGDGSTANSLNTSHTYTAPGTYTAQLTVTDTRGASSTATITVTVRNVLPTVNLTANPNPVGICNATRLTGTATDTASDSLTHRLALGDGNTVDALTANHTYATPGTYTATLTATDRFNGVGRDSVTVTVNNTAPTVTASATSTADPIRITDVVNFNGTATDPDACDSLTYRWNFGDGSTADTLNATHAYAVKGTYTATLTVTDRFGGVTTETVTVEVLGAPPVVQLGDDIALDVGETFDFSGTFTDADGEPRYDFIWRFGDGNTSVGRTWRTTRPITANHVFLESGEFTVTLEVTDRDGNTGSATMVVNVRGINTDPCATGVATIRSRFPMAFWNMPTAWDTGAVPGPNDWVLIQGDHTVVLPASVSSDTNRLQVRGICIAQNGVLQSAFNSHTTPASRLHLFAASIRNQGTITGAVGVNGSGPLNQPNNYDHATDGSSLLVFVNRFENDQSGQILTGSRGGRGGDELPHVYLSHGQFMNSQGGHGGRIEIYPAIFINNGRVQGGNGGNADNFNHWGHWIDGDVRGGNGGLVRVFATNLAMSVNGRTGQLGGGCGGDADGVGLLQTTINAITTTITHQCTRSGGYGYVAREIPGSPRGGFGIISCRGQSSSSSSSSSTSTSNRRTIQGGSGGNISVNMGNVFGRMRICNGNTTNRVLQTSNTIRRTNHRTEIWTDPTTLKVDDTTRFEGADDVVLFGGEDWVMDLRQLSEGAITADTITLAVGKDSVIDLRGVSGKAFKAETSFAIFSDDIQLDAGVSLEDLVDAPEIVVNPSKILYNVEASYADQIVGEPGEVVPVTVTLHNGGPTEDTYTITTDNTAGWDLDLPSQVQVNSMRRSELAFEITLPETRGEENVITLTATSQGDSEVQALAEIRVKVKKEERITPRNGEKADIAILIDDTMTMASELIMVSNGIENFLAQFVEQTWPSEEEVATFMAAYSEENPPSDEELNAFMAQFEKEAPTVELLTFKDDVISRAVTNDLGDVISRIRSIQPSGGDDCPNSSVAAIESALENINPNGQIIVATASSPHKDAAAAIAKAQEQGVKVHVLLTGSCDNEANEKALYQGIADETDGTFNWLPRGITPAEETQETITTVVTDTMTDVMPQEDESGGSTDDSEIGSGSETDEPETGGSETDEPETGNSETDEPETGGSETNETETDNTETGNSETGESETGEPETGEPETETPIVVKGDYALVVKVQDQLGNPIENVTLQLGNVTENTDSAGITEIQDLPEGEYTLTAQKAGYTFAPEAVDLGNDIFRQQIIIMPLSALQVKMEAQPRVVPQNDNVTYIATITNGGDETATGVSLTNVLPANTNLVSIEALDGGVCNAETLNCALPDLTSGDSARVQIVVSNNQAKNLTTTATVTSNEYPADVAKKWTKVIPHLSASITDSPDPLELPLPGIDRLLHYEVTVALSENAPSVATGVGLVMTLPQGVELESISSDYAICDVSNLPTVVCSLTDLSVDNAGDISQATVGVDVKVLDAGLLSLQLEAKVSANEYPAHTDKERTKVFVPESVQVDIAFVIDDSGSMQGEINQVKKALRDFINEINPSDAPLSVLITFKDEVKYRAFTQDLTVLLDAIDDLKASKGATCEEASVEAINFAIPYVKEGGTIIFVTDASPYEDADVEGTLAKLRSKGITFNAMVFGDCSDENSWNNQINPE